MAFPSTFSVRAAFWPGIFTLAAAMAWIPTAEAYETYPVPNSDAVVRWPSRSVGYLVNETGAPVDENEFLAAMDSAMAVWAEVECAQFTPQVAGTTNAGADSVLCDNPGPLGWCTDDQNTVAWTQETLGTGVYSLTYVRYNTGGRILEADTLFNTVETGWTLGTDTGLDTLGIAVHEVGHSLGLDHTSDSQATMFSGKWTPPFHQTLGQDDIDGICFLYPPTVDPGERKWWACHVQPAPGAPGSGFLLLGVLGLGLAITRRRRR